MKNIELNNRKSPRPLSEQAIWGQAVFLSWGHFTQESKRAAKNGGVLEPDWDYVRDMAQFILIREAKNNPSRKRELRQLEGIFPNRPNATEMLDILRHSMTYSVSSPSVVFGEPLDALAMFALNTIYPKYIQSDVFNQEFLAHSQYAHDLADKHRYDLAFLFYISPKELMSRIFSLKEAAYQDIKGYPFYMRKKMTNRLDVEVGGALADMNRHIPGEVSLLDVHEQRDLSEEKRREIGEAYFKFLLKGGFNIWLFKELKKLRDLYQKGNNQKDSVKRTVTT